MKNIIDSIIAASMIIIIIVLGSIVCVNFIVRIIIRVLKNYKSLDRDGKHSSDLKEFKDVVKDTASFFELVDEIAANEYSELDIT